MSPIERIVAAGLRRPILILGRVANQQVIVQTADQHIASRGPMECIIPATPVQIIIKPAGIIAGRRVAIEIVVAGSTEYDIPPRTSLDALVPAATIDKIVPAARRDRHVITE